MDLGQEAAALVARLEADLDELGVVGSGTLDDDPHLVEELGRRGWIAPGLPREVGGLGASLVEQMALDVVLQRRQVPVRVARGMGATLAGVIEQFGSEEQRAHFLSLIATGQFRGYLGYSEPDVGSDLASLRTRARRDGDEWVVDGTKMWGTGAHRADHVWLAARTNPDAADRRDGITVFLAPTGLPGWSCTPHHALSGEVSCTTVFDGVRIPDSCRVGEVDGGWRVITSALAAERVVMAGLAGEVGRQVDDLATRLRGNADPAAERILADLVVRQRVAEALLEASTRSIADIGGFLQAAMAKLVTSELAEDVARAAHDLLGIQAAHGDTDHALRLAPMYVIGGGTADIQRNLIARSLGLPRS
jgi:alkylation response protein AidB-like acyl-CoA dehydrogenase